MRGKPLVAAAVALFCLPASAYAADVSVFESVHGAGDPFVWAMVAPDEAGIVEWRRCADGGPVCEPIAGSASEHGSVVEAGETAAGTVFEAVHTKDGVESTARTRAWQGRVTSLAAPALQGEPLIGKTVTVAAGSWSGGWEPDGRPDAVEHSIFACQAPTGGDCWQLSYGPTVVLDARWNGWYLLAQEARFPEYPEHTGLCPPSTIGRLSGCVPISLRPPLPAHVGTHAGQTVRLSAPLGPVVPPKFPATVRPVKAPSASIRARALRSKGQLLVGRVSCETRCTVALKVSGGGRRAVYTTLSVTGAKALTVPVRHGKLRVRVTVDGRLVTSGPTIAR
jgi:hypothetical protein